MRKHPASQVKKKMAMVKQIMKHHFGSMPRNIHFMPAGQTNYVFEATHNKTEYIVRIAPISSKFNDFVKEQWAVEHARKEKVPVAEILEVGNEIIPLPYMLQRKLKGQEAVDHPDRLKILSDLGKYASVINSIPTSNYGNSFDWSRNQLSKSNTWKEYLLNELCYKNRIALLDKYNILEAKDLRKLNSIMSKFEKLNAAPSLNHGDIRLKNAVVDDKGKILAIIDWEHCTSNMAPYWDLSIALHDLSIDGKQQFLEGYGIKPKDFMEMSPYIKALNILNYALVIERIAKRKETSRLDYYKLRLKGHFDLYM